MSEQRKIDTSKYLSPNQRAAKRFRKNKPAVIGMLVIFLSIFIAIFGYFIAPDCTTDGNEQVLQIATRKMGFEMEFLQRTKNNVPPQNNLFKRLINGIESPYEMIPITGYEFEGADVLVQEYTGESTAPNIRRIPLVDVVQPLAIEAQNTDGANGQVDFVDIFGEQRQMDVSALQSQLRENHIVKRTFLLGTDKFGRDNLSRLILGVRISLSVGLVAVLISLLIGITMGSLAGFYRKNPPLVRITDIIAFLVGISAFFYGLFGLRGSAMAEEGEPLTGFLAVLGNSTFAILLAILIVLVLAILIAVFISFLGGKLLSKRIRLNLDETIMFIINVFWSIPFLLLVFALVAALGRKSWQIFLAVGLTMWVEVARIVRGQILGVREKEFVEAAHSLGFSDARTIFKHVLPNVIGPVIVITAANFASAIIIEAGLSFLGIGVQPPKPSWGTMLKEYYSYVGTSKAFLAFLPGTAILILVLAFNLVGNGLRDALDVKTRTD